MAGTFKTSLRKIKSKNFMASQPDYAVIINGKTVSSLLFSVSGYIGSLKDHTGSVVTLPESPISEWLHVASELNKRAHERIMAYSGADKHIAFIHETWDPDILRISSGDEDSHVPKKTLLMAKRIYGRTGLIPWGFCEEAGQETNEFDTSAEALAMRLSTLFDGYGATKNFLMQVANGDRPVISGENRKHIRIRIEQNEEKADYRHIIQAFLIWFDDVYPESLGEIIDRFTTAVQAGNIWLDGRLSLIPGWEDKNRLALLIEENIAVLRGFIGNGQFFSTVKGDPPSQHSANIKDCLNKIFKLSDLMAESSPLKKANEEDVLFFLKMKDK